MLYLQCLCSDMILSRPFVSEHLHLSHSSPPSRSRTPDFKDTEFIYSCLSSGLLELLMAWHRFALSSGVRSPRCMCCPQERRAHVPLLQRVSLTAVSSAHVLNLPPVSLAGQLDPRVLKNPTKTRQHGQKGLFSFSVVSLKLFPASQMFLLRKNLEL